MKIEIKFTCISNKQLQYVAECVMIFIWSEKTETMICLLFEFSCFGKIKSISETL